MKDIRKRAKNIIFNLEVKHTHAKYPKDAYRLEFVERKYNEESLVKLIRDTVPYFALMNSELSQLNSETFPRLINRAWKRISDRPPEKKGDYGELLLFLLLEVFYPAKKLITKVRLRSSLKDEIKGFDCAHFSIVNDEIEFWLGEAKFHQNFSSALASAISSINEHLGAGRLNDEFTIIESNSFEINESDREMIEGLLNSDKALDKIKIKYPVLLTYDSGTVARHHDNTEEFIDSLKNEIACKYQAIDSKNVVFKPNIDLLFIVLPLSSVSRIKLELEKMERAHK